MNRKRSLYLISAFTAFIGLSGCVNQKIDSGNAADIYNRFSTGTLRLSSDKNIGNNIWFADKMFAATIAQDWAGLSKLVIESDAGDDIGYYYLGVSAVGLKYPEAARTYLLLSLDVSKTHNPPTQCSADGMYLGTGCHGLILPRDSYALLQALNSNGRYNMGTSPGMRALSSGARACMPSNSGATSGLPNCNGR